jgi:hypothetical protein
VDRVGEDFARAGPWQHRGWWRLAAVSTVWRMISLRPCRLADLLEPAGLARQELLFSRALRTTRVVA